jgi:hypothetical protein
MSGDGSTHPYKQDDVNLHQSRFEVHRGAYYKSSHCFGWQKSDHLSCLLKSLTYKKTATPI